MPYLTPEERSECDFGMVPMTPGQLNYEITCLVQGYIRVKGMNYTTLNDIVGALECAKTEFYRRVVVPYEDQKILDNGDVYDETTT